MSSALIPKQVIRTFNINFIRLKSLSTLNEEMNLNAIIEKLNTFAAIKYAEKWDNVGLLIEPPGITVVKSILLTNDLTLQVLKEAQECKIDMIISYHPPIFKSLNRITQAHWKQKIAAQCLVSGIAVYSPHTSWDAVRGGVSDWLIEPFQGKVIPILEATFPSSFTYKLSFMSSEERSTIEKILAVELEGGIAKFEDTVGVFTLICTQKAMVSIVQKIEANPGMSKENSLNIVNLEKLPITGYGMGRTCILSEPITLSDAVEKVKKHTGLNHVRLGIKYEGSIDSEIKRVSVCPGAGVSVLNSINAQAQNADLIITGEMGHHDVLEFAQRGINVILTEHSNSERGFLAIFKQILDNVLDGGVDVHVSKMDEDPLKFV